MTPAEPRQNVDGVCNLRPWHQVGLAGLIRGAKNADRVLATRMRAPGSMCITRYGVTQLLAAGLAVCGRDW